MLKILKVAVDILILAAELLRELLLLLLLLRWLRLELSLSIQVAWIAELLSDFLLLFLYQLLNLLLLLVQLLKLLLFRTIYFILGQRRVRRASLRLGGNLVKGASRVGCSVLGSTKTLLVLLNIAQYLRLLGG